MVGGPPVSKRSTGTLGFSESLLATMQPAAPPPTITKSYAGWTVLSLRLRLWYSCRWSDSTAMLSNCTWSEPTLVIDERARMKKRRKKTALKYTEIDCDSVVLAPLIMQAHNAVSTLYVLRPHCKHSHDDYCWLLLTKHLCRLSIGLAAVSAAAGRN